MVRRGSQPQSSSTLRFHRLLVPVFGGPDEPLGPGCVSLRQGLRRQKFVGPLGVDGVPGHTRHPNELLPDSRAPISKPMSCSTMRTVRSVVCCGARNAMLSTKASITASLDVVRLVLEQSMISTPSFSGAMTASAPMVPRSFHRESPLIGIPSGQVRGATVPPRGAHAKRHRGAGSRMRPGCCTCPSGLPHGGGPAGGSWTTYGPAAATR